MRLARHKHLLVRVLAVTLLFFGLMPGTSGLVRADSYNCGAYGAGTYQNNACSTSASGGGSSLVNTGQPIWQILIAVFLILLGTLLLWRARKKMKDRSNSKKP